MGFKPRYSESELNQIAKEVGQRAGWDFSTMRTLRGPVPWDYLTVVRNYLQPTDSVVDLGTGGGERLLELRSDASELLGIDPDAEMILRARRLAAKERPSNVRFEVGTGTKLNRKFDVVLNRHAPFQPQMVKELLVDDGYFVTQQVGHRNMANIKVAFQLEAEDAAPISVQQFLEVGLDVERFEEYNVSYTILDVESLVFWLQALDVAHSDFVGFNAERDTEAINRLLDSSLTPHGVETNEHRILLVARNRS
jgi:SAM-dependent methyltransferase